MGAEEGGQQNRGVGGQMKVFQPPFLKGYPFKKGDGKTFYKEHAFLSFFLHLDESYMDIREWQLITGAEEGGVKRWEAARGN